MLSNSWKEQVEVKKTKNDEIFEIKKLKKAKPPKETNRNATSNNQAIDVVDLYFMAWITLMALAFGAVNVYATMQYGVSNALVFLAIFDLFAAGALAIPVLLWRSKCTVAPCDVGLGVGAIALIIGCMLLLGNLALNLG